MPKDLFGEKREPICSREEARQLGWGALGSPKCESRPKKVRLRWKATSSRRWIRKIMMSTTR